MDDYLGGAAGDSYEYPTPLRTTYFLPPSAMNNWPPQSTAFPALDALHDAAAHPHDSVNATDSPSHSSSVAAYSHPFQQQQQPPSSHHQQQQQIPQSRPMMDQTTQWAYATAAAAAANSQHSSPTQQQPQPHHHHQQQQQQQQQPDHHQHHHHHQQQQQQQPQPHDHHHHHHHHDQSLLANPLLAHQHFGQNFFTPAQQQQLQAAGFDFAAMVNQHQQQQQQQQQAALTQHFAMTSAAETQPQYMPYTQSMEYGPFHGIQHDLQSGLVGMPIEQHQLQREAQAFTQAQQSPPFGHAGALLGTSPDSTSLEIQSAAGSENEWQMINISQSMPRSFESGFEFSTQPMTVSPASLLHLRTASDTSQHPDLGSASSLGSFEEIPFPISSPSSDGSLDLAIVPVHNTQAQLIHPQRQELPSPPFASSSSSTSNSSPTSPTSPNTIRRNTTKKETTSKTVAKSGVKKPLSPPKKPGEKEKRVGRRKGPLRPEQRAQAGEIRKLRACLRCKFLKKTCDKGDPCAGCQPAHARLWQVPCTRIDIKEIGYFLKDWKADYERHVTLGFSVANIRGYSPLERPLFITHGFGYILPIQAREVFVRDEDCFNVDWVETNKEKPEEFESPTARLTAGIDGVSMHHLHEYCDKHIEDGFERFVDQHFEGTAFLTEMLKTAYNYYRRTKMPIIHKALKLILAYNLTQHITLVEGLSEEEGIVGKIDDENSKYYGKTLAPVMINFQVKHALAMMWRDLQKEVLEELSALYSSVYNGERLKSWPTIFMLASVLLAVWEEIQFDCHYRTPDPEVVKKFCDEMEATPVGVIVGLFGAISQKLPAFQDWDTEQHQHLLHHNMPICDAMTEVRGHVKKHEDYLRKRSESKFDRADFDSLSNKFLSKLVIRAN